MEPLAVRWWGLVRETLEVSWRGRALWRLALVSLLQLVLLSGLVALVVVPLGVLAYVFSGAAVPGANQSAMVLSAAPGALEWILEHRSTAVAVIVIVFGLWVASGVLDVAATSGMISQTTRVADARKGSFEEGMRVGFRVWWHVVGLLAIAAIPALASMLAVAIVTYVTITLPLALGHSPDPLGVSAGLTIQSAVNTIASVAGIPLGALAQMGMRKVVLDGGTWREGWRDALATARSRPLDVAVVVLLAGASSMAAGLVFSVVLGVCVLLFGGAAAWFAAIPGQSGTALALACAAGFLVATAGAVLCLAVLVLQSVLWTLFWREARSSGR